MNLIEIVSVFPHLSHAYVAVSVTKQKKRLNRKTVPQLIFSFSSWLNYSSLLTVFIAVFIATLLRGSVFVYFYYKTGHQHHNSSIVGVRKNLDCVARSLFKGSLSIYCIMLGQLITLLLLPLLKIYCYYLCTKCVEKTFVRFTLTYIVLNVIGQMTSF